MASGFLKKKNNEKFFPNPNWPIGSIYTTVNNVNPSKWFGGTWELFAPGRCLVGVDNTQIEFNTVKKTGGEKTHKLIVQELPSSARYLKYTGQTGWGLQETSTNNYEITDGEDNPHNNLQPYITVYFYIRIA